MSEDYLPKWQQYRKLRNALFAVWLSYVPMGGGLAYLVARIFGTFVPAYFVAAAWMIALLALSSRISNWPCPRCGKCFTRKRFQKSFLARKCVHCGLPKFAPSAGAPIQSNLR